MIDAADAGLVLIDTGLLDKAEILLHARLTRTPNDPSTLGSLALVYRQQGQLAKAATLYGRLHALQRDHPTAAYLHSVLSNSEVATSVTSAIPWPAPFAYLLEFLPTHDHDRLLAIARAHQDEFRPGTVEGHLVPRLRHQLVLKHPEVESLMTSLILAVVPAVLRRLYMHGLDPQNATIHGLHMALTHDGHYGRPHHDSRGGRYQVSCAYHFHESPKVFTGGDLLLYDTDISEPNAKFAPDKFTRLRLRDNALVVYPSRYYHQITRVACAEHAFRKGRFAVVAHLSFD